MSDAASSLDAAAARRDALVERLFLATVGTWDVLAVYVGDRLGLYRILAERGPTTSGELAEAAGPSERYVREWLEQQASSGILEVDDASADVAARSYDLVYIHEALHDMSYPVRALQACRRLLADGGSLIVGDERVPDRFDPPGDDIERFYYGFSLLHCLPVGMIGENAAGTGTVMRTGTVRRYAEEAGFGSFEVLPLDNDFYRFYRLVP